MSKIKSVTFYMRSTNPDFKLALRQVEQVKELRNSLLFITRQAFFLKRGTRNDAQKVEEAYGFQSEQLKELNATDKYALGKISRFLKDVNGYSDVPGAVAEAVGQAVAANWKSYYALIKAYKSGKVPAYPSIPGYAKRYTTVPIPRIALNQKKLKYIDSAGMSSWGYRFKLPTQYQDVQSARLEAVNSGRLKFTVLYRVNEDVSDYQGQYVAGLDFGLENLFTVALTDGSDCFTVSGKPLKAINNRYNALISKLKSSYSEEQEAVKRRGGVIPRYRETNRMRSLTDMRRRRMEAYYHSATNEVVRQLQRAEVSTLVIGYNTGMKTASKMSKNSNHKFIPIPHKKILDELARKCEENNIDVVWTEESYTSKSSFIDNDPLPVYGKAGNVVFSGTRASRSMYKTASGKYIPADVNAALNIIKKIAPRFSMKDVGGGCGIPRVRRVSVS